MPIPIRVSQRGSWWPAVDPRTGNRCEVLIPRHREDWAKRMGPGAVRELSEVVPVVLEKPTKIYRGLMRDDDEPYSDDAGWACYAGQLAFSYHYRTEERIPRPDRVLLVFVNEELTAYNWYWCAEDPVSPGCPLGADERFREVWL